MHSFAISLRPFCIAFVLLLLTVYVTGVYLTQLTIDHWSSKEDAGGPLADFMRQYFSSFGRTVLTLFESVAGGLSWDQAVSPLMEEISPWLGVMYCAFVAFTVFATSNVITGLFVQSLTDNAKKAEDRQTVARIRELFMIADSGMDETVTWEALSDIVVDASEQVTELFQQLDLQAADAQGIFQLVFDEVNGSMDMDTFCRECLRLRSPAKLLDIKLLAQKVEKLSDYVTSFLGQTHYVTRFLGQTEPATSPPDRDLPITSRQRPAQLSGDPDFQNLAEPSCERVDI